MIQFIFKIPHIKLNSLFGIIVLLFFPTVLKAQLPDTVYIYDTLVIYDTIIVHDTLRLSDTRPEGISEIDYFLRQMESKNAVLQFDAATLQANLILPFGNKTATIPINGIILNENTKNLESMKKYGFFGLVLFAFQTMVIAQTEYGISAGGGIWWPHMKEYDVSTKVTPAFNAGLFVNRSIFNDRLSLQMELNYHFLKNNYTYKFVIDSLDGFDIRHIISGDGVAATNFHQVSVPLSLFLNLQKYKVFTGLDYSFRISESWAKDVSGKKYMINSLGLTAGLAYKLTDRITLDLRFRQGLTTDIDRMKYSYYTEQQLNSTEYKVNWKSSQAGISIFYSLAGQKE